MNHANTLQNSIKESQESLQQNAKKSNSLYWHNIQWLGGDTQLVPSLAKEMDYLITAGCSNLIWWSDTICLQRYCLISMSPRFTWEAFSQQLFHLSPDKESFVWHLHLSFSLGVSVRLTQPELATNTYSYVLDKCEKPGQILAVSAA